jgi:hypothetical protein
MAVFVTISEGDEAVDAHPLLVIDDPGVARDVAKVIARRLGIPVPAPRERGRTRPVIIGLPRPGETP